MFLLLPGKGIFRFQPSQGAGAVCDAPGKLPQTWRIIPVTKWWGSPSFRSRKRDHLGHLEAEHSTIRSLTKTITSWFSPLTSPESGGIPSSKEWGAPDPPTRGESPRSPSLFEHVACQVAGAPGGPKSWGTCIYSPEICVGKRIQQKGRTRENNNKKKEQHIMQETNL